MIEKLKDLLFEPEETYSVRKSRQRRSSEERETENNSDNKWGYFLMVVFVPIALLVIWSGNKTSIKIPINPVSLCPNDSQHIVDTTYILIDLSESLSREQRNELQTSIEVASENLQKYGRLSISHMQPDLNNPRDHLSDLCNSADLEDIKNAVGRSVDPSRDCPNIINGEFIFHNRVGKTMRDHIRNICKNLGDLDKKIKDAISTIPQTNPEQARSYIIGSIEDVMTDADSIPSTTPTRLVIFSDMLQHADWFSQYRKRHGAWTMDNINQRRKKYAPDLMKTPPQNNFDEVLLCYQPNSHAILKSAENRNAHRTMWKDYFKDSIFSHVDWGGCPSAIANMMKK